VKIDCETTADEEDSKSDLNYPKNNEATGVETEELDDEVEIVVEIRELFSSDGIVESWMKSGLML